MPKEVQQPAPKRGMSEHRAPIKREQTQPKGVTSPNQAKKLQPSRASNGFRGRSTRGGK